MQTDTGQLIAIVESTGENIGSAAAAKKVADNAEQILKNAAKAKNALNGGNNNSGDNKPKIEPKEGSPEWDKLHPHGKAHNSDKHHPNSRNGIGKPPRDAQDALDNSFHVEGSKERIAVQDGKIIILKQTGEKLYHGYIVEDFFSIKNDAVQKALVKNGLVNNIKSGRVIK